MKPTHRRILIFVVALVVVAGGYLTYRLVATSQRNVPQQFSEARSQGAIISERIVASSNEIAASIARLSSPTSTQLQVSSTISEIAVKVSEVRAKDLELAGTLDAMARAVIDIRSSEAQQAALKAISQRLELVGRLESYTDQVTRLVVAMRLRLDNGIRNNSDIAKLVQEINAEVAAVNEASRLADELMAEFDSLLR